MGLSRFAIQIVHVCGRFAFSLHLAGVDRRTSLAWCKFHLRKRLETLQEGRVRVFLKLSLYIFASSVGFSEEPQRPDWSGHHGLVTKTRQAFHSRILPT